MSSIEQLKIQKYVDYEILATKMVRSSAAG